MAKPSGSFQRKLQAAKSMWSKARARAEEEPMYGEIDDGRYVAALSEGKITESQNGRLQVAWTYTILQGENKGETVRSYDGLESEDNLMWLARKLSRLNYDVPESIDEVQAILDEITKEKPKVAIRIKTKGEFQNVYIDKLVSSEIGDDREAASDQAEADSSDAEAPEADSETSELETGAKVNLVLKNGASVEGEVLEVLEQDNQVRVKVAGGKVYRVASDRVTLIEDVPEEPEVEAEDEDVEIEEETPPARVTKRTPAVVKRKKR